MGRVMVSRTDNAGSTVSILRKEPILRSPRTKGYVFIKTVVRWTWKSSFSKECVKTQLPNKNVLKIDDTKT